MKTFLVIWIGQFASRIGTALTRFALLIWAYNQTNSANTVALLGFFTFLPMILVSPFAGVLVDRFDRRKIMALSDAGAGAMTLMILLLYLSGNLEIWHLYMAEALAGSFEAFQKPAYTALTSQLLPQSQYSRASGLRSVAESGADIAAPVVAGLLLSWIGISGVMLADLAALILAIVTLLIVKLPQKDLLFPQTSKVKNSPEQKGQFRKELFFGFNYIKQHPGLLGLLLIYSVLNFLDGLTWLSILPVMILARSGGNEMALANVQGAFGVAGVLGGMFISIWGGPKRKIHGSLAGPALSFLLGGLVMGIGQTVHMWVVAAWIAMFFVPFISSSNLAIWQSKVPPEAQGRVLSVYNMMRQSSLPIGILLGGMLAEFLFEPAMMPGGALVPIFGSLVGTGPGAGMALMFIGTAILGFLTSLMGYFFPAIRQVENELPDRKNDLPANAVTRPI